MKKSYFAIGIILITIIAVVVFLPKQKVDIASQQKEMQQLSPAPSSGNFEAKINSEGSVTIEVVPKNIDEGTFAVILNTHSVELSDDLTKAAVLKDENGKEYRPIGWEGAPPGGHHREGILKFGPISPQTKSIALKIIQVGGIEERNFIWQLK